MANSTGEPLFSVQNVVAGYGKKQVLHGVSFSVSRGEVVGLLGMNGSGKTTLLKLMCGALAPWQGDIFVNDKPVSGVPARDLAKLVAYVPQSEDHSFDFTVRELTLMGRYPYSEGLFETAKDHEVAESSMKLADCMEFADRALSTLSGGESQRALIARALAHESPGILCDEPTTHLDPKHQSELGRLVRRLGAGGQSLVVTTHDMNFAAACCDRVVLLKDGIVTYDGVLEPSMNDRLEESFEAYFRWIGNNVLPILDS